MLFFEVFNFFSFGVGFLCGVYFMYKMYPRIMKSMSEFRKISDGKKK